MTKQTVEQILIVEDDPGVAALERKRLERAGYAVAVAATADEALTHLSRAGADLLLLDYRLPGGIDGLDFYVRLRSAGHDVPVILVTGFSDEATVIRALRAGVRDFVTKSVEYLDYLPEAVGRVLDQVRTELRLAESEARLAGVIQSATDAILIAEADRRITLFNAAAEKMFRCSAAAAFGQPISRFIPPEAKGPGQQDADDGPLTRGLRHGSQGVRADGTTFPLEASVSKTHIKGRKLYAVVVRDITERRRLEAQVLHTQRLDALGVLAGGIAHDLNNVLTPMMLALELLSPKLPDAECRQLLDTLVSGARRAAEMVKQVLTFARGAEGERLRLSLKPIVAETRRLLEHSLPKNILMETTVAGDLWQVLADSTQIAQVLMNLAINARDAMPQGGTLSIRVENRRLDDAFVRLHPQAHCGPYVVFGVADTGTGIPADIRDKIFDPFFTTKGPGRGTGLGLSTVAGIVTGHGGFVSVYSEPGRGTQVLVYVPALPTVTGPQAPAAVEEWPRGSGELVLVVDDETGVREIVRTILEDHGYRVLTAADGAGAAALFSERPSEFGVVLTDLAMPHMDGTATVQVLRQVRPDVPIIVASGLVTAETAAAVGAAGVQALLHKPYSARTVLMTLHEVLHRRGVTSLVPGSNH